MNAFVLISMIAIAALGLLLEFKRNKGVEAVFHLLLLAVFGLWSSSFYAEGSLSPIYGVISLAAINYIFSNVEQLKREWVRLIVPIVSTSIFLFLFNGDVIELIENSYVFVNKFFILALFLALFGYEIASMKAKILGRLFGDMSKDEMVKALHLFFIGVTVFLGYFSASSFGVLAVSGVLLSAGFYREEKCLNVSSSLFALMILPLIAFNSGLNETNLLQGDVLEGLFIGAFGAYFISKTTSSIKVKPLGILLAHFISVVLLVGVLFLELMYSSMGGVDAFIGGLVGLAIVNAVLGKGYSLGVFLISLTVLGTILPRFLVNEELEQFNNQLIEQNIDEGEEQIVVEYLPINDLVGDFDIVADSSSIAFTLGAKGETKGAFKKINGNIAFNESQSESSLNVELDLNDFTTFNGFRDGSLMEDSYFDQERFPTLSFKATGFNVLDKETIEINGQFTMIGVTKTNTVTMKRLKVEGQEVLVGEGEIDRTEFGMSPSATEGNVVSFSYRVLLKK
ncbi:MAG: YceI family protein [Crocinitomicaceae bacterium]